MNREIKFRGRSIKGGEWIYGDLVRAVLGGNIHTYIKPLDKKKIEVDPETVGQLVRDFYEGDVGTLSCDSYSEELGRAHGVWLCVVVYNVEKAKFVLQSTGAHGNLEWSLYDRDFNDEHYKFKVETNIHDEI